MSAVSPRGVACCVGPRLAGRSGHPRAGGAVGRDRGLEPRWHARPRAAERQAACRRGRHSAPATFLRPDPAGRRVRRAAGSGRTPKSALRAVPLQPRGDDDSSPRSSGSPRAGLSNGSRVSPRATRTSSADHPRDPAGHSSVDPAPRDHAAARVEALAARGTRRRRRAGSRRSRPGRARGRSGTRRADRLRQRRRGRCRRRPGRRHDRPVRRRVGAPAPDDESLPRPPLSESTPAPPRISSSPGPPSMLSVPASPLSRSSPPRPPDVVGPRGAEDLVGRFRAADVGGGCRRSRAHDRDRHAEGEGQFRRLVIDRPYVARPLRSARSRSASR